jgi:hypothetical protein
MMIFCDCGVAVVAVEMWCQKKIKKNSFKRTFLAPENHTFTARHLILGERVILCRKTFSPTQGRFSPSKGRR